MGESVIENIWIPSAHLAEKQVTTQNRLLDGVEHDWTRNIEVVCPFLKQSILLTQGRTKISSVRISEVS